MPVINSGIEEFHLSHDEEDKLNQFQLITDFPEDELSLIIKLLKNHGWNLEAALSRYFDGNWKENLQDTLTPPPPALNHIHNDIASPEPPIIPNRIHRNSDSASPPATSLFRQMGLVPNLPIVQSLPAHYRDQFQLVGLNGKGKASYLQVKDDKNNRVASFFVLIIFLIPNTLMKMVSSIWSIFTRLFSNQNNDSNLFNKPMVFRLPKFPITDRNQLNLGKIINSNNGNDIDDDDSKLENIIEIVGEPQDRLPFNDALQICQDEFKFMLLILLGQVNEEEEEEEEADDDGDKQSQGHDIDGMRTEKPMHQDQMQRIDKDDIDLNSRKFLTHILSDDGVLKILKDYKDDMIVYMGSTTELEPWLVARNLRVKYTPECYLIGNVLNANGSVNGATKMSILSKLRITSPRRFQNSIKLTFDKYNAELVVSRTEKDELRVAREIKQMQEQAYQDSLMKDKIKEEKRKMQEEEKRLRQEVKIQKINDIRLQKTLEQLNWLDKCIRILAEKMTNGDDLGNEIKNEKGKCATLQIRTSEGTRFVRKFVNDTTLHALYVNIGCHLYLKSNGSDTEEWSRSIVGKIKDLAADNDTLCFKDSEIVGEEIDSLELINLVKAEIERWRQENADDITFNFELISPFPRYKVPVDINTTVREVSQLWPNGSLLVEDIYEQESTSDSESDTESDSAESNDDDDEDM